MMIFLSVGLPGRFAEWCDSIITRLAESALGSVAITDASTTEALVLALVRSSDSHFVIAERQPRRWLCRALAEANKGCVVVLDDARDAVAPLINRHGFDLTSATRSVASTCASIFGYISLTGACVLRADRDSYNVH